MRRGAKALLALAAMVPALAVTSGVKPAGAVDVANAEIAIEGKGHFSTGNGKLTIGQPTNALNSGAARTDLDWVLVPFTIADGRAVPDSNFVVSAPEGSTLQSLALGKWYENAVGFRFRPGAPGMRFDGCETQTGRFRIDAFEQQNAAPFTITKLVVRFEHNCNGTVNGSVSWNGGATPYYAHTLEADGATGVIDYGTLSGGATLAKTVRVRNTGSAALGMRPAQLKGFGIEDFTLNDQCANTVLAVNATCNIVVTANPQIDGPSDATLRIFDEFTGIDTGQPLNALGEAVSLRVVGAGTGRGRVDLDGEAGNPVANGTRLVKSGTFTGSGNSISLAGTGLAFTLSTSSAMTAGSVYTIGSDATLAITANGNTCTSPTGRLNIVELGGNISNLVARFKITCANGTAGRAIVGQVVYSPAGGIASRTVTPGSALQFLDAVPVGQSSQAQPITVTNDGRVDTTVSARITGDVAQFSLVVNTCANITLAPGKSCSILVAFTPIKEGGGLAAIAIRDTFSDGQDRRVFVQGVNGTPSPGYVWQVDGEFVPLPPARILDTRLDPSFRTVVEPLHAGEPRFFDVVGKGGVPTDGAGAVVLNVTVDSPTAAAFLTVYPTTSGPAPTASNLNFVRGQTVPNLVVVPIGDGGRVNLYTNQGDVDVIVDVVGWITALNSTVRGSRLEPVAPTRILDTRVGTGGRTSPLGGRETMKLQIADPADGYTAAVINLTGTNTTAGTYVTAFPSGLAVPTASNLNLVAGQTRPNLVMVQLGTDGAIDLFNFAGNVDLVADLVGLYKPGGFREAQTGRIKPITPTRIVYTPGEGPGGKLAGGTPRTFDAGAAGAAAGLANMGVGENIGLIANFTATEGTANTFMTAYPSNQARPNASNLNVLPNENVPNLSVVTLSPSNTFDVFNNTGQIHYIFDVVARIAA